MIEAFPWHHYATNPGARGKERLYMRGKNPLIHLAVMLLSLLLFTATAAAAAASADSSTRKDPTFKQMIRDSSQIIDATILYLGKEEMKVKVNKALKGNVSGEIAIGSYYERMWQPIEDLRDKYQEGQRYIFFLKDSLVGNVPYSPTRRSVDVQVNNNGTKVRTNLLAPGYDRFWTAIDYTLFSRYLLHFSDLLEGKDVDIAFPGEVLEDLLKVADDPAKGEDQFIALSILQDIRPVEDQKLLTALLNSQDVSVRFLALSTVNVFPRKDAIKICINMLNDKATVIQSLAANKLEEMTASEAVKTIATYIKPLEDKPAEPIAAAPVVTLESPKRALLRTIISFDSEQALDIIEHELLSKDVITFRIILDVFKEYEDDSIHLLLLELMQDRNFLPLQVSILDYFQAVKSNATVGHLKSLYSDKTAGEFIRKSIVEIMENYKDTENLEFVHKALEDESAMVRQAAAKAVGTLKDPRSIEVLLKNYFREPNRLAREFYVDALSKIQDPEGLKALQQLYKQETDNRIRNNIKEAIKASKFLAQ